MDLWVYAFVGVCVCWFVNSFAQCVGVLVCWFVGLVLRWRLRCDGEWSRFVLGSVCAFLYLLVELEVGRHLASARVKSDKYSRGCLNKPRGGCGNSLLRFRIEIRVLVHDARVFERVVLSEEEH